MCAFSLQSTALLWQQQYSIAIWAQGPSKPPTSGTGRNCVCKSQINKQINDYTIISGTPKTVLPKIRHVLEYLRPGSVFFWDGDGAMTHDDQMRSLRLMGEEVIPAVREMGKELELFGPFEVNPATGETIEATAAAD